MTAIRPFTLDIPESELARLRRKLDDTRWPEAECVGDWSQGAPLEKVRALAEHWRRRYDWRRCEALLNGWGQHLTEIDAVDIHFAHIRSPNPDALPLIMTHGWPGSILEFRHVAGPLTDPAAHGGDAADAFHLVLPSLPGYGFSGKPCETGWSVQKIATVWTGLMARLGYDGFVAQGGDWGSAVTMALAGQAPPALRGVHLNMAVTPPAPEDMADLTGFEKAALASMQEYRTTGHGYSAQQSTRPQTLGYGLTDSPVGQMAWIYEKLEAWSDGEADAIFGYDAMLDNIMLYWLPATAASSGRLYWESFARFGAAPTSVPVGVSIFPKELFRASRRWAERVFSNIVHWNELEKGGHFAAWEQPELFVQEVRAAFRGVRE